MRRRGLRIFLLLFSIAWLGVIVPGHRRGEIALPGKASCCTHSPCTPDSPAQPDPARNRANCAICYFMAMLDVPASVQWDVPPLRFVAATHGLLPIETVGWPISLPCRERGPPPAA